MKKVFSTLLAAIMVFTSGKLTTLDALSTSAQ